MTHARLGRADPPGQGEGARASPPRRAPHHFTLTQERGRGLRHQREDEPAAARGRGSRGDAAGAQGRHDRLLATDHAPHHYDEKEREFDDAPNGIVGLETALCLALRDLVRPGLLSLADADRPDELRAGADLPPAGRHAAPRRRRPTSWSSTRPRRWVVEPAASHSKSRNTPFAGETMPGVVELTLVDGQVVFRS